MGVTKSNQQLQHDLTTAAFAIEDAAYDLFRITERFGDAKPLVTMEIIEKLHKHADLLKDYADEVNAGKIACSGQLIPDTVLSFSSVFAGASPSLN